MIELVAALVGALLGLGAAALLRARQRNRLEAPTITPPPPKHTAAEHEIARELDAADLIDEVAREADVSGGELQDLVDLADATRTRSRRDQ